jgi:helix-turn-helix protein
LINMTFLRAAAGAARATRPPATTKKGERMHAAETIEAHKRIVGAERATVTKDCLRRYGAGDSIRMIARETGRSYGFVYRVLVEGGAVLRQRGGPRRRRAT